MSTFVVRHVKAGSRHDWDGDDRERPVSKAGRRQAEGIADRLADAGVTSLWSSPYVRCVDTLVPLGKRLGLPVRHDDRLAEGARFEDSMALLEDAGEGAVLCTHGDVLPELIEALTRRGMVVHGHPDWRKASIWVLEHDGTTYTRARAEPPPTT